MQESKSLDSLGIMLIEVGIQETILPGTHFVINEVSYFEMKVVILGVCRDIRATIFEPRLRPGIN